jgi:cytochrome c-type biogenesis protein
VNGLLALAFGAGLLAPINPCGFGLLPAMLTATLGPPTGDTTGQPLAARLGAALRAGLALTLGFTATFAVIGIGLTAGIRSLITVVPWLAAGLGAVLALLGLALLAGRHLPSRLPTRYHDQSTPDTGTGVRRIVVFGAGYAIASTSCTLAVLLAVATQATATTLIGAVAVFTAYAAGSALLLITLALLAAVTGHTLARALQRSARYTGRIAGALLAVSGTYLLFYWLPQLLGTPHTSDAIITRLAGRVSTAISNHQLTVVSIAAALITLATTALIRARHSSTDAPATAGDRLPLEDRCPSQGSTAKAEAAPEHTNQ